MVRRTVELAVNLPPMNAREAGGPSPGGAIRQRPDRTARRASPYGKSPRKSPHISPALPTTGLSSALNGVTLRSARPQERRFPPRPTLLVCLEK